MRNVNNVNILDGKNWLKNAINFWCMEDNSIENIFERFKSFCYKDRTNSGYLKNFTDISVKNSDFSFNYLKTVNDFESVLSVIIRGEYSSYHVVFFDDEFIDDYYVTQYFTHNLDVDGIEYRGKIIIELGNGTLKYSLLFLNRINNRNVKYAFEKPLKIKRTINTSQYVIQSKSKIDKIGLKHPAPYSYIDIEKLSELENIKGKTILDPFLGVASTIIGTYKNNYNIGIELNKDYINLIDERFKFLNLPQKVYEDSHIICGDSLLKVDELESNVDVVITSPPYFNILKNKTNGIRTDNSQSRQGIEYYSDNQNDVGNIDNYSLYIDIMKTLFAKIKNKMNNHGQVYLIISDFTVDKRERDVHSDFLKAITDCGYLYSGTSYIFQNQKAIYPFGYPYKLVINHIYQYIMKFEVDENE